MVAVGSTLISVMDAHDGAMARRFGRMLAEAGGRAAKYDPSVVPDLRIVVRSAPESPEAHLRSEVLEESADLVLGSARANLARRLVNRLR